MSLPLPREHGTWAILLVPFLTATTIAGIPSPAVGVALAAVLLAFLARAGWGAGRLGQPFPVRWLGWSEVAHSLVFAVLLVVAFRLWG